MRVLLVLCYLAKCILEEFLFYTDARGHCLWRFFVQVIPCTSGYTLTWAPFCAYISIIKNLNSWLWDEKVAIVRRGIRRFYV